jgi:hypothetical protein
LTRFPANESPRRTGLRSFLSVKSGFYLPAFEITRSCRTACPPQRRYDMNGRFQMQRGKNWIIPKEMNANGSSGTLIGWKSGQTTYFPLRDRMKGSWATIRGYGLRIRNHAFAALLHQQSWEGRRSGPVMQFFFSALGHCCIQLPYLSLTLSFFCLQQYSS